MVNIGYHTARFQGKFNRSLYKSKLAKTVKIAIQSNQKVPIRVYALSCERDLAEQVASIRSFISNVGIPETFTVISDGSYTDVSCQLLRRIHPCVEVIPINKFLKTDLPPCVSDYAQIHPMGKKLSALMSIPVNGATIYTDSDILFFPGGIDLVELAKLDNQVCHYLPDCANSLDGRILYEEAEKSNPVNAGFILFKHELNWDFAIKRLANLAGTPSYFTEQTIVHLTIHHNHGVPLCSEKYVMNVMDQFIYPDKFSSEKIALRHYVSDVRHKFWMNASN
ncbi:hypothetical protein PN488_20585 [Nodularia spumigena CS-591/12]|uniref:hypothetical protein n=1 Tax=Nodularia spumigena TaxID=70799 RepID=UPI00232B0480|nr:hypothetical protein [Nodularia spumigena]MDB9306733.1 hypothetical protein [Nodularia spumigena CS-591/12]MDB9324427.1 hypothetical protein [Nodularia spumigena CS-591/07A]MDB9330278.1 hypothetical protein [Nodularia spumigena CS-591/04]MDB9344823.1 hypothetical protein [Nodularia spumigena CS-588/06]MDB9361758.1 hypothetical protein [Nodularia spumigena CS-588/02]